MNYISGICDDLLETILFSSLSIRDLIRFGSRIDNEENKISKNINGYIYKIASENEDIYYQKLALEHETGLYVEYCNENHVEFRPVDITLPINVLLLGISHLSFEMAIL
jgi:hypothetical protein